MRYFEFMLRTTAEQIKKNTTVNLNAYAYDNPVAAVNSYLYGNLKNGVCCFMYREEQDVVLSAFSYDEKARTFREAYDGILEMLRQIFGTKRVKAEPCEITVEQFYEDMMETRRRSSFSMPYGKLLEMSNASLYDEYKQWNGEKRRFYKWEEKIITGKDKKANPLYDKSMTDELSNIESHINASDFHGNPVHYVISGRSTEAAVDMAETLAQRLAKANRLRGRRMEIITQIQPELYRSISCQIEKVIENNYGGAVVIDLSEKFGYTPVDYAMTCKYMEKLVKKYRNDCLFVFTYNIENPGFAYQLLTAVRKYIISVELREGVGGRREAVAYLKELIRASDYSKYAGQAGEFMKSFDGTRFSQTDVLAAFAQFEPWCLNRNVLKAYTYGAADTFMLDREENADSAYEKLKNLIGLATVKEQVDHIIAADIVEKERKKRRGSAYRPGTMHMIFAGDPGTAKTTVARLFAGIAKEKGILKSGAFVECGGMDLNGLGCEEAIREAFTGAQGGVLFIDEAYSMNSDLAVTCLIQEMESRREEVIVILAGYSERMRRFMEINEGLKSRIPYWIDFPDYSVEELSAIFAMMTKDRGFAVTEEALQGARGIFEKASRMDNFGNGRYVRNLIERAVQNQSIRLLTARENAEKIGEKELFLLTGPDITGLEEGLQEEREAGSAQKELDEMIGLASVKEVIRKAVTGFKLKKLCMDRGIRKENPSLHMVFTGNPGTAKTTVARLFAEILKDEKILPSGRFVEVGRADLVGDHVGATAPLVRKRFREAQGGVLFIDEAYSLCDGYENSFGDEAINTIVQEMENHRDNVAVIFAGYSEQMRRFLDRNPGMSSRIAFHVEFEDYSVSELCDITGLMLAEKQMKITDAAMEKLRHIYETARENSDFGNGRFVRKMLEEAEMNLAVRVQQTDESLLTEEVLTTIEASDIPEPELGRTQEKKIGF